MTKQIIIIIYMLIGLYYYSIIMGLIKKDGGTYLDKIPELPKGGQKQFIFIIGLLAFIFWPFVFLTTLKGAIELFLLKVQNRILIFHYKRQLRNSLIKYKKHLEDLDNKDDGIC